MNEIFEIIRRIVWEQNTPGGRLIVQTILGLAIMGCLTASWHLLRYVFAERLRLERVRNRLKEAISTRARSGKDTREPRKLADLEKIAEGIPVSSLIGDRVATIRRLMQARVKVSIDALQQMTVLRESGRVSLMLPGFIVSLCMLFGLLGTFLGLSLIVQDLQGAMPIISADGNMAGTWAASLERFGVILAGKKTAFSCTLVGLFCSILVSGLNFLLARFQSRYFNRLERFTVEELLPATVPMVEGESALERFALQMGESFERLDELTSNQIQTLTEVRAIETGFQVLLDSVRDQFIKSSETASQKSINESTAVRELTRVSQSVLGLTEKLTDALKEARHREIAVAISVGVVILIIHRVLSGVW